MTVSIDRRIATLLLALAFCGGCTKDAPLSKRGAPAAAAAAPSGTRVLDSSAGSIDLRGSSPYSVASLGAVGAIAGSVKIADSSAAIEAAAANTPECADKSRRASRPTPGTTYGNTIVWIANAKSGKPLPVDKRTEISSDNCVLDPRVQGVVVGTTVNVINDDKVLHKLVFTKLGTHDTLTVTPFFNAGQIVASERIAKTPGIVEVRCAQHAWERGYIAVFDHPYFAVTEDNGTFKIDSVAPGTYTMMTWHEGDAKPQEQQVQVTAGGTATISPQAR